MDSNLTSEIERIRSERLRKIKQRMDEEGFSEKGEANSTCRSIGRSYGGDVNYSLNENQLNQLKSDHLSGLSPYSQKNNKSEILLEEGLDNTFNASGLNVSKKYPQ